MMQVLSPYVKLTTQDCIHNGYKYKEGLNTFNGKFNNKKICSHGGLYFCNKKDIGLWIYYNEKIMYYIWDVMLLDDSKIVNMGNKLKTDKFIITNKKCIWDDEELCKLAVRQNWNLLKYVKVQTKEICKLAIRQNIQALQYVKEQTEEICKLAVQQNGNALKFVKIQSDEICKLAVQQMVMH
jgi:hypothetical protein